MKIAFPEQHQIACNFIARELNLKLVINYRNIKK